jgi:hypothetical protein
MQDYLYKQNPDGSYIVNNGRLQKENPNEVIDDMLGILKDIYSGIITHNNVRPEATHCNVPVLYQALTRYSRDIYGELRLYTKICELKKLGRLTETQYHDLVQFSDYGLKTTSKEPYIHRRAANILYWLSTLKPFYIKADDTDIEKLGIAHKFHNEYVSYCLILTLLKPYNLMMDIHRKTEFFYDFLYDLHFRKLSRSSLEFFLETNIRNIA